MKNISFQMEKLSVIVLILSNLVPLAGVLFFEWNLFSIMFLYWTESGVIGFYNIFKICMAKEKDGKSFFAAKYNGKDIPIAVKTTAPQSKITLIPFFVFHYGIFMLVHGAFVFLIFGRSEVLSSNLITAVLSLFVSHGVSFFYNFIGNKEFLKISPVRQLFQPYSRIFIMHLTILIGGGIVMLLKSPIIALVILILFKIVIDLSAHIREHFFTEITAEKYHEIKNNFKNI